jgi:hypothetical protein
MYLKIFIIYKDDDDYFNHVFPLYLNENMAQVKMLCEEFVSRKLANTAALPLRYIMRIDKEKTVLGKYNIV